MSGPRHAPDECTCRVKDIFLNEAGKGPVAIEDGYFIVFLCDECDNTHVVFQFDGMAEQFQMSFAPKDAERLAGMLMNPQPVAAD